MKYKDVRFMIINRYKLESKKLFEKYWDEVNNFMCSKEKDYQDLYLMYEVVENYAKDVVENRSKQVHCDKEQTISIPIKNMYSREIWDVFVKYDKDLGNLHLPMVVNPVGSERPGINITRSLTNASKLLADGIREAIHFTYDTFCFELSTLIKGLASAYIDSDKEQNKCLDELIRFANTDIKKFKKECIYIRDGYIEELANIEETTYSAINNITSETMEVDKYTSNKNNKIVTKNIFDYKEMNKLAKINNFEYVRSNGDHDIYKNKKTGVITVIPQHTLCKSLSIAIQKQILSVKG